MNFEWMVADEFAGLAGLGENARLPYLPLCISAANQIKSRLRAGISLEENSRALCTAAASVAFYRYMLLRAAIDAGSVKAGDVTVSGDAARTEKAAKALRDDALGDVSSLLMDTQFTFRQMG